MMEMVLESMPLDADEAERVGIFIREMVRVLSSFAVDASSIALQYGVAEEHVPHAVMDSLMCCAAAYGIVSAEEEGREPSKARWLGACNETFERVLSDARSAGGGA